MNPQKCHQCSRPALYLVGAEGIPLCVDCQFKVMQIQQAQIENGERMINYSSDMMDYQLGFPSTGPRFPVRRAIHIEGVTLNNIKVDNSTVGSINTGNIGSLDIAITSIRQSNEAAADVLTKLAEAVLANQILVDESKNEVLEILNLIASELSTPKERQKTGVIKTLLARLTELVGVAKDLGTLWAQWGPVITSAFGA